MYFSANRKVPKDLRPRPQSNKVIPLCYVRPTYPVYEGPHKTDKMFFMFERSEFEKHPVLFGPQWDWRRGFWYFLSVQKVLYKMPRLLKVRCNASGSVNKIVSNPKSAALEILAELSSIKIQLEARKLYFSSKRA